MVDSRALNLATGEIRQIIEVGFRVGHVQTNPWRSGVLGYCHETGGDAPQRTWVVKADGSANRPLYKETFDEWVTHEVWSSPTRSLFTVWPKNPRDAKEASRHRLGVARR